MLIDRQTDTYLFNV